MANPRIVWDPGTGNRNFDFTELLSDWKGPFRRAHRQLNTTQGGVVTCQFEHFSDEFEIQVRGLARSNSFEDECATFWGHAGKGGQFAFAMDSSDMVNQLVRVASAASATRLLVDSSTPFTISRRYLVESAVEGGYAQERFQVINKDVASPPSIDLDRTLIWGYAVNDYVRSIEYWPKCVANQEEHPITINVGGSTFDFMLKIRTFRDLVT